MSDPLELRLTYKHWRVWSTMEVIHIIAVLVLRTCAMLNDITITLDYRPDGKGDSAFVILRRMSGCSEL